VLSSGELSGHTESQARRFHVEIRLRERPGLAWKGLDGRIRAGGRAFRAREAPVAVTLQPLSAPEPEIRPRLTSTVRRFSRSTSVQCQGWKLPLLHVSRAAFWGQDMAMPFHPNASAAKGAASWMHFNPHDCISLLCAIGQPQPL
jgi:hypothetical protein